MKLAEALSRRLALMEKSQQLRSRLKDCIKVQEGDEPTEDVDQVIEELDQTLDELQKLIYRINLTNTETTSDTYKLPKDFDASDYFSTAYGIVLGYDVKPERIVIRANEDHKHYLKSLPLHHSQQLIEDYGEYADFELYLSPTYDFVMKLLQVGSMIEVISPASLRNTMKGWISDMYELYKND